MINRRKAMLFLSSVAVMLPAVIVAENDEHGNVQKISNNKDNIIPLGEIKFYFNGQEFRGFIP